MNKIFKRGPDTGGRTCRQVGFTLIELLIVMAILGVLAVVVLVAINPVQQLARTRDAGRKSAVQQVGRALQAYSTTHGGSFLRDDHPTLGDGNCDADGDFNRLNGEWISCLVEAGELSTVPSEINYSVGTSINGCVEGTDTLAVHYDKEGLLCYVVNSDGDGAVVYALLESDSELSKCDTSNPYAFFVWSTSDGRGGLVCTTSETLTAGPQSGFVD